MPKLSPQLQRALLAALLAFLAAYGFVVSTSGPSPSDPVGRSLGGPGVTITIQTTNGALDQAKASGVDDHAGARDESPTGVTGPDLLPALQQQDRLAARDQLPTLAPDAAPQIPGCRSYFVRNYSSRHGIAPRLFVLHYTVSPNRPGWSDVNAIVNLFDRSSFAASSTFVLDAEGHCAYIVRLTDKPWTQATFNPVSVSVEVINTGSEPRYLGPAGRAKLAYIINYVHARFPIPLRRGDTSGGTVTRPGIVDHASLGSYGGNHSDIGKFSVTSVIKDARRLHYRRSASARRCRELASIRRDIRTHTSTAVQRDRARRLKPLLGARAAACR